MLLRTGTIAPLFCNPRPKISRLGRTLMAATLCYEPTRAVNETLRYFTIFREYIQLDESACYHFHK